MLLRIQWKHATTRARMHDRLLVQVDSQSVMRQLTRIFFAVFSDNLCVVYFHNLERMKYIPRNQQAFFLANFCTCLSTKGCHFHSVGKLLFSLPVLGCDMAAVGLDSEASFKSRAAEVGMSDALLTLFTNANLKTYGSLAFVCPYQPGQTDETPLFDAVETFVGRALTAAEKIPVRRLFFEAHTLALADLKMRFEKDDTTEPAQIPLAERMARLQQQKARLAGVHFSSETEPAHKVVDMVFQMCQDQQVVWIPWEKLLSRASEITSAKKEMHITFDSHGSLKLSKKLETPSHELTGEIKIRQALSRRARAFDLANLCGYAEMEAWHEKLFEILQRPPPNHCSAVTMQRAKEADKMLWKKLSEATRGGVTQKADGTKPVEAELQKLFNDPEVQYLVLPLPKPQMRSGPYDDGKGKSKGGKGKNGKDKGKGHQQTSSSFQLPEGCHQTMPNGRPICNAYNHSLHICQKRETVQAWFPCVLEVFQAEAIYVMQSRVLHHLKREVTVTMKPHLR